MVPGPGARGHAPAGLTRKNDQAWVEQKNGAVVRRLVGYGRFEGTAAAEALARLYAAARVHANLFQPSFKLREKVRVGARVTKRWHPPVTPAERALASGRLDAESVARIAELRGRADPVIALAAIRAAQAELGRRVDPRGVAAASGETPVVVDLAAGVLNAKRNGERRAIHRRPRRRVKPMPCAPLHARSPPGREGLAGAAGEAGHPPCDRDAGGRAHHRDPRAPAVPVGPRGRPGRGSAQ